MENTWTDCERTFFCHHKSECVCVCVPVNSVNAHDEGLYVRVGGAAELAAGLSAERGAVA